MWVKAEASHNAGQCVEVELAPAGFKVRDSKNPGGPTLFYTDAEWDAFGNGMRNGEFTREALAARESAASVGAFETTDEPSTSVGAFETAAV